MLSKCSTVDNDHQLRPEVNGVAATGSNGFMLFGVRVMEGSFRKSFSMNNLAQYDEQTHQEFNNDIVTAGYVSDNVVHPSGRTHERKRGVPWSEEEHKLFLLGLQTVGKGDWRGISKNFVKTRTPTQVASHAQKYFLRRNNYNRRRRRSSLFDITTDAVQVSSPRVQEQMYRESLLQLPTTQPKQLNMKVETYPPASSVVAIIPLEPLINEMSVPLGQLNRLKNSLRLIRPIPIFPPSSKMANLDLRRMEPSSLSLNLSVSLHSPPPSNQETTHGPHATAFKALPESLSGGGEDSIISVA